MNRKGVFFLALALSTFALGQDVPQDCAPMVAAIGAPKYQGDPPDHTVLCRIGYVLSHNTDHKTPDWTVERLTPDRFKKATSRQSLGNPFAPDPDLKPGQRSELKDYRGSGYDRGHMAPAGSMVFDEQAMIQSFYLSNMTPQVGKGMNQGIWAKLEEMTRDWACERGEVIVMTGPIYDNDKPKTIGDDKVAVPTAFYKIAYAPSSKRAIAFILPNKSIDLKGRKPWDVLKTYVVSVRDVQERTGLDFLSALPARDESRLEGTRSVMWPQRKVCKSDLLQR